MSELVTGIVALNLILAVVGYCLIAAWLRRLGTTSWLSYAGVALLAGLGSVCTVLAVFSVLGGRPTLVSFGITAAALASLGLVIAWRLPAGPRPPLPLSRYIPTRPASIVATVGWFLVVAVLILGVVTCFQSYPWLDDTYRMWLPKGLALRVHGLDLQLFNYNDNYFYFSNPHYPFGWSVLLNTGVYFVGDIDLRATDAQVSVVIIAFVAAIARLLWGIVRPWILALGSLLLLLAPELWRQAQGGGVDIPLAIYLALFVLCGGLWLARADRLALLLAAIFAVTAVSLKGEGTPGLVVFALILSVVGWQAGRRRIGLLWLGVVAAIATSIPWLLWQRANEVLNFDTKPLPEAFDPGYLGDRSSRFGPSLDAVLGHIFAVSEWTVIVPLALALSAIGAILYRRALWLAPWLLVITTTAFLVWVFWADQFDLDYRLSAASYRVVAPLVLVCAIVIPILAEQLLSNRNRTTEIGSRDESASTVQNR